MAEYIDREKIRLEVCSNCTRQIDLECQYEKPCGELIAAFLNEAPADVAPVVHAKWIDTGERTENEDGVYTCSACGHNDTHSPGIEVPHCWFCGAKMDGGEKANE